MATAIKVENLSKIYRLGEIGTGTISRDIERWIRVNVLRQDDPFLRIGEANDRSRKGSSDIVYSLRDINFEIEHGDAVGIIGRNGAGKSTLLKILSRVTAPTTGRITLYGRVASLLEVGTGFHPELTGRENIYLNGAIQGMRRKEIDRKLDEIIDFSGVERYIDTPVKRYSSGMYVRLAFAVAAHLESEILIVDEVLAVGDAEFQKKCLGKMGDVSRGEGRTVLFVSHNIWAIKTLCNSGILIENGMARFGIQNVNSTIDRYLKRDVSDSVTKWEGSNFSTDSTIELKAVQITAQKDAGLVIFSNTMPLRISICYNVLKRHNRKYRILLSFFTQDGANILNSGVFIEAFAAGSYCTMVDLPAPLLGKNRYKIFLRVDIPDEAVYLPEMEYIQFDISEIEFHSFGAIRGNEPGGYIHPELNYRTRQMNFL